MPATLTQAEILAAIREVARRHLAWSGPVTADMDLVEAFKLDSLRLLTLVIEIENRFRICLDDEDEQSLQTVGDLVRIIEAGLAKP